MLNIELRLKLLKKHLKTCLISLDRQADFFENFDNWLQHFDKLLVLVTSKIPKS